jgi:hypothetical protein
MNANFNLCDVCGGKVEEKQRFWITTDRQMDAAGSMDDVGQQIDLCPEHLLMLLKSMLRIERNTRVPDYDAGIRAIRELQSIKARHK